MMRVAVLLLLVLTSCQSTAATGPFPKGWVGVWAGKLRIYGGNTQTVPMELHIAKVASGYTWKIVYAEGSDRQDRNYLLRVVDAKKGEWEIDERNSIVLRAQMRGGVLVSRYAVGATDMTTVYRRAGDVILFELFAGSRRPVNTTGGQGAPSVDVFDTITRQEAALTRIR